MSMVFRANTIVVQEPIINQQSQSWVVLSVIRVTSSSKDIMEFAPIP